MQTAGQKWFSFASCIFIFKVLIFIFFYGSLIGSLAYVAELDDFFNPRKGIMIVLLFASISCDFLL